MNMGSMKSVFGWKAVFANYSFKDFAIDSIFPTIISVILCVVVYCSGSDMLEQIKHILSLGIAVVPSMVALILAAYTIMLSFILSETMSKLKASDNGRNLIQTINASFAACLLVSTITIIVMLVVSSVANLNIEIEHPNRVNYPIFFIICYLLTYSVCVLIGVVVDIFNSGQTTLIENN